VRSAVERGVEKLQDVLGVRDEVGAAVLRTATPYRSGS